MSNAFADSPDTDGLAHMGRVERVETLPDVDGSTIDALDKDSRLAPEPDYTPPEGATLEDLGEACRGRPASERVQILFGWRPTDYQALVLDYIVKKDRAQIAPKAGRQVGKTEIAGIVGAHHVFRKENTDILYTAPGQDTADEMFDEFKDTFKNGPLSLDQYGVIKDNAREWKFNDGTRASSRTLGAVGQDDSPGNRGRNPTCVVVDEAAYELDSVYTEEIEEFFITHEEYTYLLCSTPAPNNYFEERANPDKLGFQEHDVALAEEWSWYAPYWPTKISPFAQQDFIDRKRDELDSDTFDKEFRGIFPDESGNAISHTTLTPNLNPDPRRDGDTPRVVGIDPARGGDDEMVAFDLSLDGTWWNVWAFEAIDGPAFLEFVHGIHTGERYNERVSVPWGGSYPDPTTGTGTRPSCGYQRILIEENGVGGFAADFADAALTDVVRVVNSTNKTKQNVYQRFITDLEAGELDLPNHRKLVNQTTALEKTFTPTQKAKYSHPPGGNDDWPDGAAFANWARHGNGEQLDGAVQIVRKSGQATRRDNYS